MSRVGGSQNRLSGKESDETGGTPGSASANISAIKH